MSFGRICLLLVTGVVSLGLVAHTLMDPNGWRRRSRLAADLLSVSSENEALEERASALRAEVQALEASDRAQEHAIRDELGWLKPGDLVIHFTEP